ncbi:MAG TPA: DNA recombination protein RmuC [Vicinamibacterales bacterium]|nr:DNA recombination protein RmuC [Vicinamibacterales bacterium]
MTIDLLTAFIIAAVTALVVVLVMRSIAARQVAEMRAASIAELAATKQDLKWVREDAERKAQALDSAQTLLDNTEKRLRDTFQALAADALKDNRASFLDLAKTSFQSYQQPIAESLSRVDHRLREAERERVEAYSRLSEQVVALGSTANTLSRALRTPAVRGRWGEMQLRRVVEIAGMLERCDFDEQPGVASDNGRRRPDLIVHLPGGKQIVVDAKTPLDAFLDAQECNDDERRAGRLQAHARQVRDHMDRLGNKAYWEQMPNSPEMVVMFLPGETLFSTALQQDLTLIEHGLEQKVLLASPITLIALLTTVAHSWRHEALTENYREVARLGKEFYERLATFADRFDDVRKRLDGAVQAYNDAAGSFESRVLVSARRLRELDVTSAPELPFADPIERVPRVLKQAGLMGLPEGATTDDDLTDSQ